MMKRFSLVFAFFFCVSAFGYIPPSEFQIRQIAKKKSHLKKAVILSSVSVVRNESEQVGAFFEKVQIDYETGVLQSLILNRSQEIIYFTEYSFNKKEPLTKKEKSDFSQISSKIQAPGTVLLLLPNERDIFRPLTKRTIPIQLEEDLLTLTTEEERQNAEILALENKLSPTWVIGKKENSQGELWVQKDSFLPIKMIWPFSAGSDKMAVIEFNDYQAFQSFIYPKEILYKTDDQVILRVQTKEVDASPNQIQWLPSSQQGWARGLTITPDLKEAINAYYQIIR